METKTVTDKQRAILEAMLSLVAERGFHGTAMSQVAKRSGVSAGIIYHYFDNKEDLIHALYYQIKSDFSAAMAQGDIEALDFPDDLKLIWRNAYDYYVSHPKEATYLDQYENSPYNGHIDMNEMMENDANMRLLVGKFTHNFESGKIRPMPFMVMYELTMGVASGLAKRTIQGIIELDDAKLDEITNMICKSVQAK